MKAYDELKAAITRAPSHTERWLYFVVLLGKAAGVSPDDLIVVGGSALEIYTSQTTSQYTTGDIDLVSYERERLAAVLGSWGFKGGPRLWTSSELNIFIDLVGAPYTGDITRTQVITTPFGAVRVAGIEDLMIKRLASAKHVQRPSDVEHAKVLMVLYSDRLDWAYLQRLAVQYDVADYLDALQKTIARK